MNKRRIFLIILIYVVAILLATSCSSGPVRSCKDDPEQMRCQPRERGGRNVEYNYKKWPRKLRMQICSSYPSDAEMKIFGCRKRTLMAGL